MLHVHGPLSVVLLRRHSGLYRQYKEVRECINCYIAKNSPSTIIFHALTSVKKNHALTNSLKSAGLLASNQILILHTGVNDKGTSGQGVPGPQVHALPS